MPEIPLHRPVHRPPVEEVMGMAWVKLDDGFTDHPKIAHVGAIGAWLQIQALCYCNRNLTDGFVPYGVARAFLARGVVRTDDRGVLWTLGEHSGHQGLDLPDIDWPGELVKAGIWEVVAGGYRIHDYDHYQRRKVEVLAERRRHADRQQNYTRRKADAVSDAVTDAGPVPVPRSGEDPEQKKLAFARKEKSPPLRTKVKTPWPDGFVLTDELAAYATRQGLDARYQWGKFKAHALRDDVRHVNWVRAWEYWVRNAWEIDQRHA
jgi:hypothetical protein